MFLSVQKYFSIEPVSLFTNVKYGRLIVSSHIFLRKNQFEASMVFKHSTDKQLHVFQMARILSKLPFTAF